MPALLIDMCDDQVEITYEIKNIKHCQHLTLHLEQAESLHDTIIVRQAGYSANQEVFHRFLFPL